MRRVLLPVIARYRDLKIRKSFQGDAAFTTPKLFRVLEQQGYRYAIRLKASAVKWTRLSCRRFKGNQVRLQLFALVYNLANFLRQPALPRPVRTRTLTTLRERLIKIGAKVVRHAKAVTFELAEVAVPRALFVAILGRIGRLPAAPSPG
jgi:hypothetical protein